MTAFKRELKLVPSSCSSIKPGQKDTKEPNEQLIETKLTLVNLYLHLHSLDADLKIFCERKDRKVS